MKKLLYGAAYYDEYMPYDRLQQDVAMMKKAGINTVRIAESTCEKSKTPSCGSQVLHVDSAILTVLIPAFFIIATSCCRRSYGIYSS